MACLRLSVVLSLVLAAGVSFAGTAYECPYSGPDEDSILTWEATRYQLDLRIAFPADPEPGSVAGTAAIDILSHSDALADIHLDFLNDADASVTAVTVNGSPSTWDFTGNEIIIPMNPPLADGDAATVAVTYRVAGSEHFQFKPNRPPKIPRLAVNAMVEASRWFPCLHDPRDKATYTFNITVDDFRVAACNGTLESVTGNGDGTRTFTWTEHSPMATYLAAVHVGEYELLEDNYNGIPIRYYVEADKVDAAAVDFANDHEILDFYTSAFGPYPFEKIGLAQTILSGGMENQDMISYGLITGDGRNEDVFAHEMSHMWWGDSVTLTDCVDTWLNEGFASYCEALWEEHFYGSEAAAGVMDAFRDAYFQEDANNRFAIYDPDIVWGATVYRKGAWVLHMLRAVMGEDAFWAALPDYYDRYKFGNATTADFQAVCESHFGGSLDWFFREWVYEPGYPEFDIAGEPVPGSGDYRVFITQTQTNHAPYSYRMPVDIRITSPVDGGTPVTYTVTVEDRFAWFDFPVADPSSVDVVFDPDNRILKTSEMTAPPATGAALWMTAHTFTAGDTCACRVTVLNPDGVVPDGTPLFVILDVHGSYFFWPGFTGDPDYTVLDHLSDGFRTFDVLPAFTWPDNTGTLDGVIFYAAMTNREYDALLGTLDTWSFGWHD